MGAGTFGLAGQPLRRHLTSVPNQLTAMRLGLVPVLWLLAVLRLPALVGIGLLLAGLSDALDGFIARRLRRRTAFGGQFDSLADVLLAASAVGWLLLLRPAIFADHPLLISTWLVAQLSSLAVGWVKFRRIGNLHLYSAKAAGIVQYVFFIQALLSDRYNQELFFVSIALAILTSAESLALQLGRTAVDEHIGSILRNLPGRSPRGGAGR